MAWIIQNNQLINDEFINAGTKPFVGDSPYTMWQCLNGDIPSQRSMIVSKGTKPFVGDSPYVMWRIDPNDNGGSPYIPLMIGVAKLASFRIYIGDNKIKKIYWGDNPVKNVKWGDI